MNFFRTRAGAWIFFALACGLICALRLHSFSEPLEADEAIMAVIAHDWTEGGKPYVTAWENKPVGSYAIYRAGLSAFGATERGVRTLALLSTLLSTLFLFLLLRRHHRLSTVTLAVLMWVFLTVWTDCHANGANSETFLLPFILAAMLCVDLGREGRKSFALMGALVVLPLSLLVKQVTLPFLFVPPFLLDRSWRRRADWLLGIVLSVAAWHLLVYSLLGYDVGFLRNQVWGNFFYAAQGHQNSCLFVFGELARLFFDRSILWLTPLFVAGVGFAISCSRADDNGYARLVLVFFLAAIAAVMAPGWTRPHYFLLLLPFVPLLMAFGSEALRNERLWRSVALTVLAFLGARVYLTYLKLDAREISKEKYDNLSVNWFLRDRYIGREALKRGFTGGRAYASNNHPGILFYSGNRPAARYFVQWMHGLPGNPPLDFTEDQLKANPPDTFFLPETTEFSKPFGEWLGKTYAIKDTIDGCEVLARRS